MLEYQEDVQSLAVDLHDSLVELGLIEENSDAIFIAILNFIDGYAGFPEYKNHL